MNSYTDSCIAIHPYSFPRWSALQDLVESCHSHILPQTRKLGCKNPLNLIYDCTKDDGEDFFTKMHCIFKWIIKN